MKKTLVYCFVLLTYLPECFALNVGQRFFLTLPENYSRPALEDWMAKTKPAGVMLLASHFKNRDETRKLTAFLQSAAQKIGIPPLLISTDWEGGIVSRPNEIGGFFSVTSPHNMVYGGRDVAFLSGQLIGQQLRDVGVNVTFAPSLDLFGNQIYATRCFSEDPKETAELGIAFCKGLMSQGVLPVIKHFPGLKSGPDDTHLSPTDLTLGEDELPFFIALESGVPMIMSTHAICSQKFGPMPVTLSAEAVRVIKSKNPKVILVADDFCMESVRAFGPLEEICLKAIRAGQHLIIFSAVTDERIKTQSRSDQQENLMLALQQKVDNFSKKDSQDFERAIEEINELKQTITQWRSQCDLLDERWLSVDLAARSVESKDVTKPITRGQKCLLLSVDLPLIRKPEKWFIADGQSYFAKKIAERGIEIQEYILNPFAEKSFDDIDKALDSADEFDFIILQSFFYGNAKSSENRDVWLKKLKKVQSKTIILSLGHPHEMAILPDAFVMNLGSFQIPLLDAAVARLVSPRTRIGADKLVEKLEHFLANKKFGLLCNNASYVRIDGDKKFLPDLLFDFAKAQNNDTQLAALFSPEHGLLGNYEACAAVDSSFESKWGCPIYSLHGKDKRPSQSMLNDLDLVLIDLRDIGVRCFTYLSTMKYMLQAAATKKIPVIVLDGPNPLSFWPPCGPMLSKSFESIVGEVKTPFITGKTIGQIAVDENKSIGANLSVLLCENLESTAFYFKNNFVPPSPNLSSLEAVYIYPMTVFIEGTNYSEGRGTDYPFQQIGAPWIDAKKLAQVLSSKKLAGVYFEPTSFTPKIISGKAEDPKYKNKVCYGVFVHLYDAPKAKPIEIAKIILKTLFELYPQQSKWLKWGKPFGIDLLVGNDEWRKEINLGLVKNVSLG